VLLVSQALLLAAASLPVYFWGRSRLGAEAAALAQLAFLAFWGLLAGVIFLLPYMVALTTLLGRAEGGARLWSRVSFAAGVCFVAITIAINSIWTGLALGADAISDDGMRTLMYLDAAAFYIGIFPLAVFVSAGSLVIVATGAMRKWLGYLGLADGIALFAAPLVVLQDHSDSLLGLFYFLALVAGAAWIVATGVAMLRLREEPVDAPAGAPA